MPLPPPAQQGAAVGERQGRKRPDDPDNHYSPPGDHTLIRSSAAPLALRTLGLALALALALTPFSTARADGLTHVVQPGENLFRIGLRPKPTRL